MQIELEPKQLDIVWTALSKLPAEFSREVMNNIEQQVYQQQQGEKATLRAVNADDSD